MPALSSHTLHSTIRMRITLHLARNWRLFSEGEKMDSEQDLRENQRQYLDFLDDNVCHYILIIIIICVYMDDTLQPLSLSLSLSLSL